MKYNVYDLYEKIYGSIENNEMIKNSSVEVLKSKILNYFNSDECTLTSSERKIIINRFFEGKSFGDISKEENCTRQNIDYIEKSALKKLSRFDVKIFLEREV